MIPYLFYGFYDRTAPVFYRFNASAQQNSRVHSQTMRHHGVTSKAALPHRVTAQTARHDGVTAQAKKLINMQSGVNCAA